MERICIIKYNLKSIYVILYRIDGNIEFLRTADIIKANANSINTLSSLSINLDFYFYISS